MAIGIVYGDLDNMIEVKFTEVNRDRDIEKLKNKNINGRYLLEITIWISAHNFTLISSSSSSFTINDIQLYNTN